MQRIAALCAFIGAMVAVPARAQTEVGPQSDARSLACLSKPDKAPTYPARHALDRASGGMRVLLKFTRPDAAPEVQVLFNSAREDMQDEVHAYLRRYRLTCLTAADGVVTAVQEFSFSNTDRDPTPMPWERGRNQPPLCLVQPRTDMSMGLTPMDGDVEHVVAVVSFNGDGQQPPEVKFVHSTGNPRLEHAVRERVAEYRMPCRQGTEAAQSIQQQFSYWPPGRSRATFNKEAFSLVEFLRMVKGREQLVADFDFNTMGCPFKVTYGVYGGNVPNEATVRGAPRDPNRQPFLAWMASQKIAFQNERQQRDLFGSQLQIDIPCTTMKLGQPAAS